MSTLLTLLILLACPIMMYLCMRGMRQHGGEARGGEQPLRHRARRGQTLEERLALLEAEQEALATNIAQLRADLNVPRPPVNGEVIDIGRERLLP